MSIGNVSILNYLERYHNSKIVGNYFDIGSMLNTITFENGEKTFIGFLTMEKFDKIQPSYEEFEKDYGNLLNRLKETGALK